jgi:hypothetical protein
VKSYSDMTPNERLLLRLQNAYDQSDPCGLCAKASERIVALEAENDRMTALLANAGEDFFNQGNKWAEATVHNMNIMREQAAVIVRLRAAIEASIPACPTCDGDGRTFCVRCNVRGSGECEGDGRPHITCPDCGGTGRQFSLAAAIRIATAVMGAKIVGTCGVEISPDHNIAIEADRLLQFLRRLAVDK